MRNVIVCGSHYGLKQQFQQYIIIARLFITFKLLQLIVNYFKLRHRTISFIFSGCSQSHTHAPFGTEYLFRCINDRQRVYQR